MINMYADELNQQAKATQQNGYAEETEIKTVTSMKQIGGW